MARVVLTIDIGSSFTKVHLVDRQGHVCWVARRRAPLQDGPNGLLQQDMTRTLADVRTMLTDASRAGHLIQAIIPTGQMGGAIPVGPTGALEGALDTYLDSRFGGVAARVLQSHGDLIWRVSGGNPFVAPKVRYAMDNGTWPTTATHIINASSAIGQVLAGLSADQAYTDRTQAWLWGTFDARRQAWDAALASQFGIDQTMLPLLHEPWHQVGGLCRAWANDVGLPEGLPVFAGAGDGMVGWFGVGARVPGDAVDTAGTTDHLGIALEEYAPDPERRILACTPAVEQGLWFHQGWASGSGLAYEWVSGHLQTNVQTPAQIPPGSDGVMVMPFWAGRTSPDQPEQRGAILGLRPAHHAGHIVRATLEAIAYEYAHWAERSAQCQGGIRDAVWAVGSGAQNDLWLQIKADVLGIPFWRCPAMDYAARGLAQIAWHGLGEDPLCCSPPDPQQCEVFTPDEQRHLRYRQSYQRYLEVAETLGQRIWHAKEGTP